jgi:glycosyltransferase involved in cell wall biosynthesis
MQIAYLYNEKLPKKTAHDVYIWRNVYFLSQSGQDKLTASTLKLTYITGPSHPKATLDMLQKHYLPHQHSLPFENECAPLPFWSTFLDRGQSQSHHAGSFEWIELPLMRKSGPLRLSWNLPFFLRCQKWLEKTRPDWVMMSVYKQAHFHLQRKLPGVRYLFEVHDLAFYPGTSEPVDARKKAQIQQQKEVLEACDAITVTTHALKRALEREPYHIKKPIFIVPLASEMQPLPPISVSRAAVNLAYVGQLYPHQGLDELIQALSHVEGLRLEILGGNKTDLERLKSLVYDLKLNNRVVFHGFISPQALASKLYGIDALVAPFHPTAHMRHVAHTKLIDYGRWALPVIAPNLEITREEVRSHHFLFDAAHYPQDLNSLIQVLKKVLDPKERLKAAEEIRHDLEKHPARFSWQERTDLLAPIFIS